MIKMSLQWCDLRSLCIKHGFYTSGDNYSYQLLCAYVGNIDRDCLTENDIDYVVSDIVQHSNISSFDYNENEFTNFVEWCLLNECITYVKRG